MRVGVIGGGITGLATVHELRERDVDAVGFEAGAEVGGVIRSERIDGTLVECGPQRLRPGGITRSYLETFGLLDELVAADADAPIFVYSRGQLRRVPFGPWALVRTDLLRLRDKLRLALEPLSKPMRPGETVAAYFTRKLGEEAYRGAIEPLYGGLYGSDPAEMPADIALDPIVSQESGRGILTRLAIRRLRREGSQPPPSVPAAGMQALPEAIYEANAAAVRLETPVERIDLGDQTHHLVTADGREAVDHIVVATDAPAAAALLAEDAPEAAERLDSLRYNPLALVYLQAPHDREGLGYQVRRDTPYRTLGVSWNGAAFDRDDLVTVFLGGMHDPELVQRPDDELTTIATEELAAIMDVEAQPLGVRRITPGMPAYDHSWRNLDALDVPSDVHLVGSYTARVGIPGRLRQARELAIRLAGR